MEAQTFLDNFGTIAQAPGGIDQLRQLVLNLAVQGWLVEQEPGEEGADPLLSRMQALRDVLVDAGVINRPRHPSGVPVSDPRYELPDGWAWSRLGDISAIVGGGTPKSTEPSFWSDEPAVPWLTPADMRGQENRYVSSGSRDISELGLKKSSAQLLPKGSVLFSSRAPIGHVAIASRPLATNQGFKSSVPYAPEMSEYIYLFLRKVGPEIDENATGTTFKEVSGKEVSLVPVPVPPLAEQHRIVTKVDELMALCDQLETQQQTRTQTATKLQASALNALTTAETADDLQTAWQRIHTNWEALTSGIEGVDELRRLIRKKAVQGGLSQRSGVDETPSGPLDWGVAELRLKEEKLWSPELWPQRAPDGWATVPLAKLGVWGSGGTPTKHRNDYYGGTIPWLVIGDLNYGIVTEAATHITELGLSESSAKLVPEGSVLTAMYGASVGKAAITGIECTTNQAIAHCVPDLDLVSASYLFLLVRAMQDDLITQAKGMAQPNISQTILRHLLVALPPTTEQDWIVARVNELMDLCEQLEARLVERDQFGEALAASVADAFAA